VLLGIALCLGGAFAASGAGKDGPEDTAAQPASLTVRGHVFDASTLEPIALFRLIPGAPGSRGVTWQPHLITTHERGRFALAPDRRAWAQTVFRVEAVGYRPGVSRLVLKAEGEVALDFALVADAGPTAVVHTPDGTPAAEAEAAWATVSYEATALGPTIRYSGHAERLGARVVTADAEGRFRLPPESDPATIMIAHPSGYAEIDPAAIDTAPVVKLRRWGRVEGRVRAGTKPVAGQRVRVYRTWARGGVTWESEAVTDGDGRFLCDRVAAGQVVIDRLFASGAVEGIVNGLAATIEVHEGEVTHVALGGPGRTVTGRFEAPKDLGLSIDWSKVHARLGLNAPHIGFPGDDRIWETYGAFLDTDEGEAYYHDDIPIGPDGSFRIKGVPPARYLLIVWVSGAAVGKPVETGTDYAMGGTGVEVRPAPPAPDEPIALGTIVLSKRNPGE
jgi:hypothetical protein